MNTNYDSYKSIISLDIETQGQPDSLAIFEPKFEQDKRLTDPAKIEASNQAKRDDWQQEGALKAERGRIIGVGYSINGATPEVATSLTDESSLIHVILNLFTDCPDALFVGHNLLGFDLPFIRRRCWMNGISFPFAKADKWNPWTIRTFDTMKEWQLGNSRDMVSLDSLARGFGYGGKLGSGKDFAKLLQEDEGAAWAYLSRDVELSYKVARRMIP